MTDISTRLGDKLHQLRKEAKKTEKEVGYELGINHSLISRYENEMREPPLYHLQKLSEYYSFPLLSLIDIYRRTFKHDPRNTRTKNQGRRYL